MNLVLDTHFVIWLILDPSRLKSWEQAVLSSGEWQPVLSAASILEMRIKWERRNRQGVRKGELDPTAAIAFAVENDIALAALSLADCAATLIAPIPHKDPFDQMLLIHTQQLGARLLTRDGTLRRHPLALQP